FFGFSWLTVSEWVGRQLERLYVHGQQALDAWRDRRAGQRAQAEREQHVVVQQERFAHEVPVRIEPGLAEVPQSKRQQKERSKAEQRQRQTELFAAPVVTDGSLPSLSLLDPAPAVTESIPAETLEFT